MTVRHVATFPSEPTAPAQARVWLTERLDTLRGTVGADVLDDVRLVVTELLTNAIRAGTTPVRLVLRLVGSVLRVEVTDDYAEALPAPQHVDPGSDEGRGLQIVAALAQDWGWRTGEDGSKTVWAEIPIHQ